MCRLHLFKQMCMYACLCVCTVGTESIQTPLNFSLCYIAAIC